MGARTMGAATGVECRGAKSVGRPLGGAIPELRLSGECTSRHIFSVNMGLKENVALGFRGDFRVVGVEASE